MEENKEEILDKGEISDGYHTFNELYDHRITLYIALLKSKAEESDEYTGTARYNNGEIWMSKSHSDGSIWDGWFILGFYTEPSKQITYHLPMDKWDECEDFAQVLDKAPDFDGHTSNDVLERIKKL